MSINSNMGKVTLQLKEIVESPTGAKKEKWIDKDIINISIFKTNDTSNIQSVKYNESTHVAVTFYSNIDTNNYSNYRLIDNNGVIYNITSATPGRKLTLLLKVVSTNV